MLITCEKAKRDNNYFKLRGTTLILQLYTYFLINRMSSSSRLLRLSFIGPGIYFCIRICSGERDPFVSRYFFDRESVWSSKVSSSSSSSPNNLTLSTCSSRVPFNSILIELFFPCGKLWLQITFTDKYCLGLWRI